MPPPCPHHATTPPTISTLMQSLGKLQSHVNSATNKSRVYLSGDGKTFDETAIGNLKKTSLAEGLKANIKHVFEIKAALHDLELCLKEYETRDYESFSEKVLEKFSSKIIEQTKNELIDALPKINSEPKKVKTPSSDQTLIVDINKDDIETNDNSHQKSFSAALKQNLNDKLKNIPVTKTAVNKQGDAILTFPSVEICLQAKTSLQSDYKVSVSDRKPAILLPRLKINQLDPKLTSLDRDELKTKIISKNEVLKNADESEFNITYIEKNQNYAVAKVSPKIFHALVKNGRIFIDLCSYYVSEHFHPIQCYKCQSFGHTSSSEKCSAKEITCLYCGNNHKSSECPNKKVKNMHNCSNCKKSMNSKIKSNFKTHSSTSKSCPTYIREIERLKENTCYDQNVYIGAKNQ